MTEEQRLKLKEVKTFINEHGLNKRSRYREYLWRRYYLVAYIRQTFDRMPLKAIGELFNLDHSTLVNALRKHEEWIKDDKQYRHTIQDVAIRFPIKGQKFKEVDSVLLSCNLTKSEHKFLQLFKIANDIESDERAIDSIVKNFLSSVELKIEA